MIVKYYKVTIGIPESVWQKYGHTQEYDRLIIDAVKGSISSGSDSYSFVEEWAEFNSLEEAQSCECKLMDVVYKLQARILDGTWRQ